LTHFYEKEENLQIHLLRIESKHYRKGWFFICYRKLSIILILAGGKPCLGHLIPFLNQRWYWGDEAYY